jgi:hypothetical protein
MQFSQRAADSSDVTIGSAVASDKNCLDNMIEEEATKRQEGELHS